MPDQQKTLEFRLTTIAELEGAKDLAEQLERQIGRAKALGENYTALKDKLDIVKESITEATPAITAQAEAFDKTAYQAQVTQDELAKLGNVQDELSDKTVNTREKHRALEMTMLQLNQLVPGLGDTMFFLASGYKMNAEAAEAATAANEDFLESMGALSVVVLAVQAAVTWYHFFADAAKEAQEAQSRALQKLEEGSEKAYQSWTKLQNAISGKSDSPTKKYEDELDQKQQIAEARERQQNAALDDAEQEAMANATTPEQKAIVKQQFENQRQEANLQRGADKHEQQGEVMQSAQSDLVDRMAKIKQETKALKEMPVSDFWGRTGVMNAIADQSNQATELAKYIDTLKRQLGTEAQIGNIDIGSFRHSQSSQARTTFETAVHAGLGDYGSKTSADQQAAIDTINQIFKSVGGLFQPVLEYLKQAHLNQQQFQAFITTELNALKQAQSRLHNNANAPH